MASNRPAQPAEDQPKSNVAEFSVSEISFALKRTVEDTFGYVRVRGEISGYRGPHSSGHSYFALKDDKARLEAVIWRGAAAKLKHRPEEGLEVVASGKLTTYPGSSKYQIVIDRLEPAGAGALMALLEECKKKLAAEGLFDEAKKRPLPHLPKVIGVVTSPTGSVIRDVLHRLSDRYPCHVLVWPVRVQGETSGTEVAAAITGFGQLAQDGPIPRPDLVIVARGGGSIEDLWGFNDEAVVRAAAASPIPLISAVGHETDWTLIDLAADVRAPTPTGAAEIAVPVRADLEAGLASLAARLRRAASRSLETVRSNLRAAVRGLASPDSLLELPRRRLDEASARSGQALRIAVGAKRTSYERSAGRLSWRGLEALVQRGGDRSATVAGRLSRAWDGAMAARRARFEQADRLLHSLSWQRVLDRGYAVVSDAAGRAITKVGAVNAGMALDIRLTDGSFGAQASGAVTSSSAPRPAAGRDKPKARSVKDGGQGDLF